MLRTDEEEFSFYLLQFASFEHGSDDARTEVVMKVFGKMSVRSMDVNVKLEADVHMLVSLRRRR